MALKMVSLLIRGMKILDSRFRCFSFFVMSSLLLRESLVYIRIIKEK